MTYTQIATAPYPTWEINLGDLSSYSQILGIMKNLGVEDYVYTFKHQGKIIKHGYSADNQKNFGERIYRQAANLPGWGSTLSGSSGKEMADIAAEYKSQTGIVMDRKDVTITVRDLTGVPSNDINDPLRPVKELERKLLKEYEEEYGELPIGNIKNEGYMDKSTYIPADIYKDLFELV